MNPRKPTEDEKRELAKLLVKEFGNEMEDITGIIENSAAAVFDDYITGSPGYAGKVMMIIWEASPSIFDVYTWLDGQIRQEQKE